MTQEQDKAGTKIIEGMTEALAVAKGETPAAAIWHNGHRYVPEAEIDRLKSKLEHARERNLTAHYRADCAHAEVEKLKAELDDARDLLGRCERVFDLLIKPEAIAGTSLMVAFAQCHETRAAIRALAEAEGKEG